MFHIRFKRSAPTITGSLLISLAILAGCTVSASPSSSVTPPQFAEPLPAPLEITVAQLYSEYSEDEAAADAKYGREKLPREKLLFNMLVVEEVGKNGTTFKSGNVIFTMSYSLRWNIEPGFILNIEGICSGLHGPENLPTIKVSHIESIKGDIGVTSRPAGGY